MKRNLAVLMAAMLLQACGRGGRGAGVASMGREELARAGGLSALGDSGGARMQSADKAAPAAMPALTAAANSATAGPTRANLKLIFTASLNIEVTSFKTAVEETTRTVTALGGYVSNRTSNESDGGTSGQLTLRIPTERFEGAMGALRKLGRVRHENVGTDDVTKQYADVETRLKVKRETAARLREILANRTGKLSDVLEVEREIARVVEEIESAEGEKRYYDNLVSLSTVTLTLAEPASIVTPGALDPLVFAFRNAARIMSESAGSLIEVFSGLLPWLVALYAAYRLLRWRFRRAK